MNYDVVYPSGWQYAPTSMTVEGSVDLTANVTGQVKSTYYFSGYTDQVSFKPARSLSLLPLELIKSKSFPKRNLLKVKDE
jgi:hypothetical protein